MLAKVPKALLYGNMSGLVIATCSRVFKTSTGFVIDASRRRDTLEAKCRQASATTPAVVPHDTCAIGSKLSCPSSYLGIELERLKRAELPCIDAQVFQLLVDHEVT